MARVVLDVHAERDLAAHYRYLVAIDDAARLRRLDEELTRAAELLAAFPELGYELLREPGRSLRRLRLGRIPLFLWYVFESEADLVTLLRVFHVRQQEPTPALP